MPMPNHASDRDAWQQAYLQRLLDAPQAHFAPMQQAMQRIGVQIPTLPQPVLLPYAVRPNSIESAGTPPPRVAIDAAG